jgi:hypothetical protein
MEKGNGEATAGPPVSEAEEGPGGGGTQPQGTDRSATSGQSSGGQQADQTRERDPWAGTPDSGETTLRDGTKLRRDAKGDMYRGPDSQGREQVWQPDEGRWVDAETRRPGGQSEGWGEPGSDWQEAWGGEPLSDAWKSVPRSGSTKIPEGTLQRDGAGNYRLDTPDGALQWNEQSGQWYDAQSGRQAPPGLGDPVADWQGGTAADAYLQSHPEVGLDARPTWRDPVQP